MKRSPWCNDCGFLSKIARGVLLTQRGSTLPINTQGLQDTLQRMPHCWMLALTNQSKYLPCPLPFSPSDNTRKEQRIRGERNDVRVILVLPPPFSPFVPLRMQSIPNPSWDFLQSIASNPYASAIATVTSSNQHEHPFHLEGDLQWWGSFIQHTLLISLLKSSLQTTRNSPSVKFPVFQCWALFQLNIWKSHSESLLKNNYSHYHLGSDPVVCTLTQMVFYEGRFVCSGVFFFFFPGWVLQWKLHSGFPTLFSQQLEGRGCCPLSCKQKGQAAVPGHQDKHTLLLRGQPRAVYARQGGGGGGSCCLLSYYCAVIHAKVSPQMHQWLPFKRAIFLNLLTVLISFLCKDALLKLQERELIYTNPFQYCLCKKMCTDIKIFKNDYLFTWSQQH